MNSRYENMSHDELTTLILRFESQELWQASLPRNTFNRAVLATTRDDLAAMRAAKAVKVAEIQAAETTRRQRLSTIDCAVFGVEIVARNPDHLIGQMTQRRYDALCAEAAALTPVHWTADADSMGAWTVGADNTAAVWDVRFASRLPF